jgi:hypothetical protein
MMVARVRQLKKNCSSRRRAYPVLEILRMDLLCDESIVRGDVIEGVGGDLALSGVHVAHGSFARFFNSANARPAKRPSLVAVESSSLVWSVRPASNALNQWRNRARWSGGSLAIASAISSTFMRRSIAPARADKKSPTAETPGLKARILRPEVNLPHGKTSRIVAVVQYRTMGEKGRFQSFSRR